MHCERRPKYFDFSLGEMLSFSLFVFRCSESWTICSILTYILSLPNATNSTELQGLFLSHQFEGPWKDLFEIVWPLIADHWDVEACDEWTV